MKITVEKLTEMKACPDGIEWFKETFPNGVGLKRGAKIALECDQFAFANWFISRQLSDKNKIQYAIYAAELVLHIFEEKYPDDKRPWKAIEASKNYLILETDAAAYAAAYAADAAYADGTTKVKIIDYGVSLILKQRSNNESKS